METSRPRSPHIPRRKSASRAGRLPAGAFGQVRPAQSEQRDEVHRRAPWIGDRTTVARRERREKPTATEGEEHRILGRPGAVDLGERASAERSSSVASRGMITFKSHVIMAPPSCEWLPRRSAAPESPSGSRRSPPRARQDRPGHPQHHWQRRAARRPRGPPALQNRAKEF